MATRYYKNRLWKVSEVFVVIGGRVVRFVKHYERRTAIGRPWTLIRSVVAERDSQ